MKISFRIEFKSLFMSDAKSHFRCVAFQGCGMLSHLCKVVPNLLGPCSPLLCTYLFCTFKIENENHET